MGSPKSAATSTAFVLSPRVAGRAWESANTIEEGRTILKRTGAIVLVVLAVLGLVAEVALAQTTIYCNTNPCYGTEDSDHLLGDDIVDDTIYALGGSDYVYGDHGDDTLYGGTGNDDLIGDQGNDNVYGEAGNDQISVGGGDEYTEVGGSPGVDRVSGGGGSDTVYAFDGFKDIINCGKGTDTVYFDKGIDTVKNCEKKHPNERGY